MTSPVVSTATEVVTRPAKVEAAPSRWQSTWTETSWTSRESSQNAEKQPAQATKVTNQPSHQTKVALKTGSSSNAGSTSTTLKTTNKSLLSASSAGTSTSPKSQAKDSMAEAVAPGQGDFKTKMAEASRGLSSKEKSMIIGGSVAVAIFMILALICLINRRRIGAWVNKRMGLRRSSTQSTGLRLPQSFKVFNKSSTDIDEKEHVTRDESTVSRATPKDQRSMADPEGGEDFDWLELYSRHDGSQKHDSPTASSRHETPPPAVLARSMTAFSLKSSSSGPGPVAAASHTRSGYNDSAGKLAHSAPERLPTTLPIARPTIRQYNSYDQPLPADAYPARPPLPAHAHSDFARRPPYQHPPLPPIPVAVHGARAPPGHHIEGPRHHPGFMPDQPPPSQGIDYRAAGPQTKEAQYI